LTLPEGWRYTTTAVVLQLGDRGVADRRVRPRLVDAGNPQGFPRACVRGAFNLHKSVGLLLLALALIRLGWRIAHRPPPLPPLPRWQAWAAKANHALLYTMMLVMPLSGYLGSVFSGYPISGSDGSSVMGIRRPGDQGPDERRAPGSSWILLVSLSLHVVGTIKHTIAGDRVMARMGFGRRPPQRVDAWTARLSTRPRHRDARSSVSMPRQRASARATASDVFEFQILVVDDARFELAAVARQQVEAEVRVLADREIDVRTRERPAAIAHLDAADEMRRRVRAGDLVHREPRIVRMADHELGARGLPLGWRIVDAQPHLPQVGLRGDRVLARRCRASADAFT
jgi:cytochrome b561